MKMTKKEKYISLIKEKEELENSIDKLGAELTKKCEHGVEYGYLFPYPKICLKCSVNYYKYCKKNNMYINEVFFLETVKFIENERDKKREFKQKEQEQKRTNRLLEYQNKKILSKEEVGFRYERYIGYLLEIKGFRVDYHGILKKKKDRGIDIIATFKKKAYIIQCKRYSKSHEIHENTITQLIGSVSAFKMRHIKYSSVNGILYTSSDNLDEHAKETLESHGLQHIVSPYDENYPMVKCNIGSDGERIYHLPGDALYDRIKIEINKNEFYCKTIEEAEANGFRRAAV